MSDTTRRGLLVATGGSAAAVAAMSLIGAAESAAAAPAAASSAALPIDGAIVAFIENRNASKITVFSGTGSTTITDAAIVRALVRKAEGS